MNTVVIQAKTHDAEYGAWFVECSVTTSTGTRSGTESIGGPDTLTDEELKTAIIAKYI